MSAHNIIEEIKSATLRGLRHFEEMPLERAMKRAYMGSPGGQRPDGQPMEGRRDEGPLRPARRMVGGVRISQGALVSTRIGGQGPLWVAESAE